MKYAIPPHQRANHEATDHTLGEIRGLVFGLDALRELDPNPAPATRLGSASAVLMDLLMDRIVHIDRLRGAEWVGIGGAPVNLTAMETAIARGEVDQ